MGWVTMAWVAVVCWIAMACWVTMASIVVAWVTMDWVATHIAWTSLGHRLDTYGLDTAWTRMAVGHYGLLDRYEK